MDVVVFLGDSLLAWNPRTDVHNFAVPGYTTTELLFQIQKLILKILKILKPLKIKVVFYSAE